jgi:hypothetical protein
MTGGPGTENGPLDSNNCGVCYELIGPNGAARVIIGAKDSSLVVRP